MIDRINLRQDIEYTTGKIYEHVMWLKLENLNVIFHDFDL